MGSDVLEVDLNLATFNNGLVGLILVFYGRIHIDNGIIEKLI
jgi:hypothetical protein